MTTPRENLLKVFRHEEPDWVPIVALADSYNRPSGMPPSFYEEMRHMSPSRALSRYFDIDTLDRIGGCSEAYRNVERTGFSEGGEYGERWETRHGVITLRRRSTDFPCGSGGEPNLTTGFPVDYPVQSVRDLRAVAAIFEDVAYAVDAEAIARAVQAVGDTGIVTMEAPCSPLMWCAMLFTGVEFLAYAYHDHHRELCSLLETMAEKSYECYRLAGQTTVDGTINYDNTTTLAISPRMFREFEVPYLKKTAEILHASGKLCIHHACGHVLQLLDDLRETGIDGFDGPAAPPVGNTTVAQARAGLGDGIAIMPFTEEHTLKGGDPGTVRDCIRSLFAENGSRRNLAVMIVPPPGVPVANLWLAVDEAKRLSHRAR